MTSVLLALPVVLAATLGLAPAAPGYNIQDAEEFWDRTNRQDWHICEQSQLGISSRVYAPGPYSPRESIPAAWDRTYLRAFEGS